MVEIRKTKGGQATTGNDYKSNLYPTGYLCMLVYKVVKGHTIVTCTKRNDGHMGKSYRADTMGGSTKNSGWVAGA